MQDGSAVKKYLDAIHSREFQSIHELSSQFRKLKEKYSVEDLIELLKKS